MRNICEVKNKEQVLQVVCLLIELAHRCAPEQEVVLVEPIGELFAGISKAKTKGLLLNSFGRLTTILCVRGFWQVISHLFVTQEAALRDPKLEFATRPLFQFKDLIDHGITVDQILDKFSAQLPDICLEKMRIESEMLECGLNSQLLEESTLVQPLAGPSSFSDRPDQQSEEESPPIKQLKTN